MPLSSGKAAAGALETAPNSRWLWETGQHTTMLLLENFPSRNGRQEQAKWPAVQCLLFYFFQVLNATSNYFPVSLIYFLTWSRVSGSEQGSLLLNQDLSQHQENE